MRRSVVGVSGFVLAALLFGGLVAGIGAAQTADNGTNASFGAEVSSFMQASEAEAESEVDNGMFETELNRTADPDERRAIIEQREQRLEQRHQELRSQRGALDGAPNVRAYAVATRVAIGASELERSANETAKMAARNGANARSLGALRSNARGLRDRNVEKLTPGIAKRPATARGPPDGVGPGNGPNADRSTVDRSNVDRSTGNASRPAGPAVNRSNGGTARAGNRSGSPPGQVGKNGTGPANGSQQSAESEPGRANGGNGKAGNNNEDTAKNNGSAGNNNENPGNNNGENRSNSRSNNKSDNGQANNSTRGTGPANGSEPSGNSGQGDTPGNNANGANGAEPERPFEP